MRTTFPRIVFYSYANFFCNTVEPDISTIYKSRWLLETNPTDINLYYVKDLYCLKPLLQYVNHINPLTD